MRLKFSDLIKESDFAMAIYNPENQVIYSNDMYQQRWRYSQKLEELIEMSRKDCKNSYTTVMLDDESRSLHKIKIERRFKNILFTALEIEENDINEINGIAGSGNGSIYPDGGLGFAELDEEKSYNFLINSDMSIEYSNCNINKNRVKELFDEDMEEIIRQKARSLKELDSIEFELDNKLINIVDYAKDKYVMNVYPYAKGNISKYDEITKLKLEVEELKRELRNKNKLIRTQKKIFENISILDPVTKLYNRNYFYAKLEEMFLDAAKYGNRLEVIKLKIKNLKEINENHGLKTCDEFLIQVSHQIKENMRRGVDTPFRISSKEIIILSVNSKDDKLKKFMEMLKNDFSKKNVDMEFVIKSVDINKNLDEIIVEIL